LLLLQETHNRTEEAHYVLITDIGKFFRKSGYHKIGMCKGCFKPISSKYSRHIDSRSTNKHLDDATGRLKNNGSSSRLFSLKGYVSANLVANSN